MIKYSSLVLLAVITLCFSCVTHKKYKYLIPEAGQVKKDTLKLQMAELKDYQLQIGDILDIKVASNVSNDIEVFNRKFEGAGAGTNGAGSASSYFNGYIIDKEGNVEIPLIGKLKALGLTCEAFNDTLKTKLAEYINYSTVTTKLGVFRITILGEVANPGTKELVNLNSLNIYQAIGFAGDVTELGNKKKVKLVRKNGTEVTVVRIDLSSTSMIGSKYYYLQPNDVLYIEPLKAKILRTNSANIALALSAVTFVIVLINYLGK